LIVTTFCVDRADVQKYHAECAAKERANLQLIRTDAILYRLNEEDKKCKEKEVDKENQLLENGARDDVKRYLKSCKDRRHLSLAFRAKEHRRHQQKSREMKKKVIEERHNDSNLHSLDQKYVALAREKERAKAALDALYHLSNGCTFAQNPFTALLN